MNLIENQEIDDEIALNDIRNSTHHMTNMLHENTAILQTNVN